MSMTTQYTLYCNVRGVKIDNNHYTHSTNVADSDFSCRLRWIHQEDNETDAEGLSRTSDSRGRTDAREGDGRIT